MFSSIHDNVYRLLSVENLHFTFHDVDEDVNSIETYDTNIMGEFRCYNPRCTSKGWSSLVIAITIRMYPGEQYNARVYYQRCKECRRLCKPILSPEFKDSYAERVAYRLKKWSEIVMEPPYISGESNGPHENALCEGCRAGHCSQSRRTN